MTTIVVSIVSTGERAALEQCLDSLAAQRFDGEIQVVVVENGRRDGSAEAAESRRATVLRYESPRGFAENHNAAIRSHPSDYALVLNPDVILAPDCVAQLVAAMQRHERAAIVVPLLVYPSGEPQPSARRFPRLAGTILRRTPLRRAFPRVIASSAHYLPPPEEDRIVDWALGACVFARRERWDAIGGFDDGFRPLYVEDVDLAWRVWKAGWEVWQTPSARAIHEHQAATDKSFWHRRTLWHMRGMLRFVGKHPRILFTGARPRSGTLTTA